MAKITDDELAKLRTKHPKLIVFETTSDDAEGDAAEGDSWVFRAPKRADWMTHKALVTKAMTGDVAGTEANTFLGRGCLVWPKVEAYDALRERAPAIPDGMGAMLLSEFRGGLQLRVSKSSDALQDGGDGPLDGG